MMGLLTPTVQPWQKVTAFQVVTAGSQWHGMYCHDLEVMNSNPGWVELGVLGTSVLSRTWIKNHQANGAAKATVKTVKRLFKRCTASGEDPCLGLLNLRNTPAEGRTQAPYRNCLDGERNDLSQLLTVTNLTTKQEKRDSEIKGNHTASKVVETNHNWRNLPSLQLGQTERLQPIDNSKVWKEGTVTSKLNNWTFEVESNGKKYVWNRQLLLAAKKFTHDVSTKSVPTARVPSTPGFWESLNTTESHKTTTAKNAEPPAIQPLPVTPYVPYQSSHCAGEQYTVLCSNFNLWYSPYLTIRTSEPPAKVIRSAMETVLCKWWTQGLLSGYSAFKDLFSGSSALRDCSHEYKETVPQGYKKTVCYCVLKILKFSPCTFSLDPPIFAAFTNKQFFLLQSRKAPLGGKVSMLTHIYPHKARRKIEVIICKITRLTAHFMCGLMSDLLICTCL